MKRIFFWSVLLLAFIVTWELFADQKIVRGHAVALHGDIKYGPGFEHFDYVNPNAPKGGTVRLAALGTFDSLNPFILKGVSAAGIGLIFDTLTYQSYDEPFTEYGLLAETIEMPEDRSWVSFTLRKEARWHDGSPVTADDLIFTFSTLTEKGAPFYRHYYQDVIKAEKLSSRKVRFLFRGGSNPELPLIMGQLHVISKKYYTEHDFEKTTLDPPLGCGPYKVVEVKPGRSITYKRDPNYWGKDLAVNRGRYNFDTIRYEYYRDETVIVEAFKAGNYDLRVENVAKVWVTAYRGPDLEKGSIIKEEIPNNNPERMQGFVFNTRRDIFKDRRVRHALAYVFDFEWMNKTLFYNQYVRTKSYFANSELASSGLPTPSELAILEPYRDRLPEEVFTREYSPPTTDGSGDIRKNLREALELFREAGWELKKGKLVNEDGRRFEFELLLLQPSLEKIAIPFKKNLERLGIEASIRFVDTAQYVNRLDNYDFDMTSAVWAQSLSPGNEQRDFWSSEAADRPGTRNLSGIHDPVVDELIEKIVAAPDRRALVTACRALDRVLLWGHYVIPHYHAPGFWVVYWNKFGRPKIRPKYAVGFIDTWWVDSKKEKALEGSE